jgi:hypothetical protein
MPFVQDFVKRGKWDTIQDYENADLQQVGDRYLWPDEYAEYTAEQARLAANRFDRAQALHNQLNATPLGADVDRFYADEFGPMGSEAAREAERRIDAMAATGPRGNQFSVREMLSILADPDAWEGGLADDAMAAAEDYLRQNAQPRAKGGFMVKMAKGGFAVEMAKGGGAWTRKEGKNPEGGLNAKGRASLRAQGHDIKPPVSAKQAKKSPKAAARRKSFCARMSGMPGPMKDDKGRPTRKALSLRKWDC